MSEVKQWLMSIGIPGIERLVDKFESRGFSTRKFLQYLQDGDLDYIVVAKTFGSRGEATTGQRTATTNGENRERD